MQKVAHTAEISTAVEGIVFHSPLYMAQSSSFMHLYSRNRPRLFNTLQKYVNMPTAVMPFSECLYNHSLSSERW